MELNTIVSKLKSYKNGTYVRIDWEKDVSSAKARSSGIKVVKQCRGVFRLGLDYANLSSVKDLNLENSTKESWFKHSEVHKSILENKKDSTKTYLQVFTGARSRTKANMLVNGISNNPQSLYEAGLITKAALPSSNDTKVFVLSTDCITCLGR